MPKNLTRHRRTNKRGGQAVDAPYVAPYVAPAPAPMPTYVASAPAPAPTEEGWFAGLGDKFKGLGDKFKGYLPNSNATTPGSQSASWFGGRKRMRAMRGGSVNASDPLSLATNASPISGISSARAHNWVGGRTRAQKRSRSQSRTRTRRRSHSRSRARR